MSHMLYLMFLRLTRIEFMIYEQTASSPYAGACEGMGEGLAVVPGLGGRPGGSASKALSAGEKEAVRN